MVKVDTIPSALGLKREPNNALLAGAASAPARQPLQLAPELGWVNQPGCLPGMGLLLGLCSSGP